MAKITPSIPILDLSWASNPDKKSKLLEQLHSALFDVGFLYITNHGVPESTISNLTDQLPTLFDLPQNEKAALNKLNSPHFLGYSGFAEETTLGEQDLREQFDFATELPVVYDVANQINNLKNETPSERDFSKLYWRLRGPNQWPSESSLSGFREAFTEYHDALEQLSYRFVHLIEEAFHIPIGTFDHFFGQQQPDFKPHGNETSKTFLPPQHRLKLLHYPPSTTTSASNQGVGAHKDSSGWLTFLYQIGHAPGLQVQLPNTGAWIPAPPIRNSFVVNFGNAFEAATEGAVRATVHRVIAPGPSGEARYSIPFFQGLPLDMTVREVRGYIPEEVRALRRQAQDAGDGGGDDRAAMFLDQRWDELGESQLRKWIRSHEDVGLKWYGRDVVDYYAQ
ncbi:Hypothetical protein R9X50_00585400 [Acrodontium crateriforme]|uniref:Fe2OG dioxygenase domain-containing protein n=1 Tax=Acrodontium crateriforme TaxID=150365 RepID=A0AAQ3M6Z9_9PEZI|nr:Hypothetical protein R9X50_00585400 [Acrodontium crateriforme]